MQSVQQQPVTCMMAIGEHWGSVWALSSCPHFWLSNAHCLPLVSHSYSKSTWVEMNWLRRWDIWLCNACSCILPVICTRHPVVRNHSFLLILHCNMVAMVPSPTSVIDNNMVMQCMLTIPFIIIVQWLILNLEWYKEVWKSHLKKHLQRIVWQQRYQETETGTQWCPGQHLWLISTFGNK